MKTILLTVIIILIPSLTNAKKTITITNGEWDPLFSKNLKHYGVTSHIVTEAFALEGYKVKYSFYPWTGAVTCLPVTLGQAMVLQCKRCTGYSKVV